MLRKYGFLSIFRVLLTYSIEILHNRQSCEAVFPRSTCRETKEHGEINLKGESHS